MTAATPRPDPSPKAKQGWLRHLKVGATGMRIAFNLWPPFLGAGIHVERIDPQFREAVVRLRLGLLNRNLVGTHFGGSLFAMTDPFLMIMFINRLGPDYVVWDRASRIQFKAPGRGTVRATFRLSDDDLAAAIAATASGEKYEPWFAIDVVDHKGDVIATVDKQLYIRRKRV